MSPMRMNFEKPRCPVSRKLSWVNLGFAGPRPPPIRPSEEEALGGARQPIFAFTNDVFAFPGDVFDFLDDTFLILEAAGGNR